MRRQIPTEEDTKGELTTTAVTQATGVASSISQSNAKGYIKHDLSKALGYEFPHVAVSKTIAGSVPKKVFTNVLIRRIEQPSALPYGP